MEFRAPWRTQRRGRECVLCRAAIAAVSIAALLLSIYAAVSPIAVPWLARRALERHTARVPGATIRVGTLSFNPFTLALEATDLRSLERVGQPTYAVERARIDLAGITLLRARRPTLDALTLVGPRLEIDASAEAAALIEALRGFLARARIDRLTVERGALLMGAEAPHWSLNGLTIRAESLDLRVGAGRVAIGIEDFHGSAIDMDAEIFGNTAQVRLALRNVELEPVQDVMITAPYLAANATLLLGEALRTAGAFAVTNGTLTVLDRRIDQPVRFELADGRASWNAATSEAWPLGVEGHAALAGGGAVSFGLAHAISRGPPWTMRIRLDDVPAPALNGYALRALGAELDGGRVGVDMALTANAVFVGHAELIATNLLLPASKLGVPTVLGLALLEDRGRAIKVELPIEVADSGPPVATVVADELGRHLARLGAAPHSTLGALVGRDADALRAVGFLPAEPVPTPAGAETLVALAEALALRPRVGVVIRGGFDPLADRRALATRQVELHVLLATAGSTHRVRPQPVDFASPRAQDVLDEFARERLPPEAVATLASLFDLRGNAGPASSARLEYYRAIFDALVAHESIPESALVRLGRFRAQAIRNMLAERGVDPQRIAVLGDTARLFATATDVVSIPLDLEPVERDTTVNLGSGR